MSAEISLQNATKENGRPVAEFHPSLWGDLFLKYTPDDEETRARKEEEIRELKKKVKKELFSSGQNPQEQLSFIDAIQRLGVAYHFEVELEELLQLIFQISLTSSDEMGKFKESLSSDVRGVLNLYEAADVRLHGEDILDEALAFAKRHLNSMTMYLSGPILERVNHAMEQPLHQAMTRLEARQYISIYEHDPSHNKTLLRFAKLDFNFLLSLHREELRDIARWWEGILSSYRFARNRLAEAYFWTLGGLYEPQYSLARKIFSKVFLVTSIIDDIYDAYGVFEELEFFTKAVQRWDKSSMNQLPAYMKFVYQALLDTFEEIEQDLTQEGRAHLVHYAREQMKIICETYMQEARWRNEKRIPPYEEYVKNSRVSFGYDLGIPVAFLGMGDIATREAFEWARRQPKPVIATGVMGRLKNDMGGNTFQQQRDHVASAVECYMKEYGVSEQKAREELNKQVENAWKDINEGMLRPYAISKPLLARILELSRLVNVLYKGEDGYTMVSQTIKNKIALVLVHQVPI